MSSLKHRMYDALNRGREWFFSLDRRERSMVALCALVALIAVLFLGVWEPIQKSRERNQAGLERARQISERIDYAAALARSTQGRQTPAAGTSLIAAVDQSSKQGPMGKAPTRIQPQGEKELRVWFEDVSFAASVRWIDRLQNHYGIQIKTLDIEPESAPGRVKLRATLSRPS